METHQVVLMPGGRHRGPRSFRGDPSCANGGIHRALPGSAQGAVHDSYP